MAEDEEGNANFSALHDAIDSLSSYLNEDGEAEDEETPEQGLRAIVNYATAILGKAQALTADDFEEEYPETDEAETIDAEPVFG